MSWFCLLHFAFPKWSNSCIFFLLSILYSYQLIEIKRKIQREQSVFKCMHRFSLWDHRELSVRIRYLDVSAICFLGINFSASNSTELSLQHKTFKSLFSSISSKKDNKKEDKFSPDPLECEVGMSSASFSFRRDEENTTGEAAGIHFDIVKIIETCKRQCDCLWGV